MVKAMSKLDGKSYWRAIYGMKNQIDKQGEKSHF